MSLSNKQEIYTLNHFFYRKEINQPAGQVVKKKKKRFLEEKRWCHE